MVGALPGIARTHYTNKCLIDEIILTNDIEGVRSTRKELGTILNDLGKRNKKNRFYLYEESVEIDETKDEAYYRYYRK